MRYLVDGYNVLHAMGLLPKSAAPGQLERARQALLGRIAGALGDEASQVVVFFDAAYAPSDLPRRAVVQGIQVIFSPPVRDADTLIEEWIRGMSAAATCVVSADRRLQQAARRKGCQHLSPEAFLEELEKRRRQRLAQRSNESADARFRRDADPSHWLKEFAHLDQDPTLGPADPFADLDISTFSGEEELPDH